jgi:hypothetical protein
LKGSYVKAKEVRIEIAEWLAHPQHACDIPTGTPVVQGAGGGYANCINATHVAFPVAGSRSKALHAGIGKGAAHVAK